MPKVKDLMTTNLFVTREGQTLEKVAEFMKKGRIRHVIVVNAAGGLAGLISQRDLLQVSVFQFSGGTPDQLTTFLQSKNAQEVMKTKILTTTPDADLCDAASVMQRNKIGCLPVLDGPKIVGIITTTDFMNLAWEAVSPDKQ